MVALQTQFLASKSQPLRIGDHDVVQMDRIPIKEGVISVHFISKQGDILQGVALRVRTGGIVLSDGSTAMRVNIWDESGLPRLVQHKVQCPDGELRVWNIYKATADRDLTRADAWTNNAGMIVEEISNEMRRYHCSDGLGDFDPTDLVFEVRVEPSLAP
jgi:hypothetical protein